LRWTCDGESITCENHNNNVNHRESIREGRERARRENESANKNLKESEPLRLKFKLICQERKTEKNDVAKSKGESKMRKIVVRKCEKYCVVVVWSSWRRKMDVWQMWEEECLIIWKMDL